MHKPSTLTIEVSNDGLDGCGWSTSLSVSEIIVLVRWDHHRRVQFLLILTSGSSISEAAKNILSLNVGSFFGDSLSDLGGVFDPEIGLSAVQGLIL